MSNNGLILFAGGGVPRHCVYSVLLCISHAIGGS